MFLNLYFCSAFAPSLLLHPCSLPVLRQPWRRDHEQDAEKPGRGRWIFFSKGIKFRNSSQSFDQFVHSASIYLLSVKANLKNITGAIVLVLRSQLVVLTGFLARRCGHVSCLSWWKMKMEVFICLVWTLYLTSPPPWLETLFFNFTLLKCSWFIMLC